MATNTYVALKTTTVGTATPTVTLDNISQAYTDLVLIVSGSTSGSINNTIRVGNGSVDTNSNYSCTIISGNGSTTISTRRSNDSSFQPNYNGYTTTGQSQMIVQFQNYSNTSTYKTILSRSDNAATGVDGVVGLWRSTSAIDTIQLLANGGYNWQVGSTFTVYGVVAEGALAKATGGAISSDANYWYHTFTNSGTFTPSQALSVDYLVVAGGGGGGGGTYGGGGGAGGARYSTGLSLSTATTVTVGSGGATTTNGTGSSLGSISASGGGGGGSNEVNGKNGGSGGGGSGTQSGTIYGGSGNTGGYSPVEGYGGGNGIGVGSGVGPCGGGGGAGGAGYDSSGSNAGDGGNGITWLDGNSYAGGGGGGRYGGSGTSGIGKAGGGNGTNGGNTPYPALPFTGSGGGGGGATGGQGGSGIVIVRYAK